VWEWVEDDWHGSYEGAPADGRAWVDNQGSARRDARRQLELLRQSAVGQAQRLPAVLRSDVGSAFQVRCLGP